MKKNIFCLLYLLLVAGGLCKAQVPFKAGNFVVCRIGDGINPLSAPAISTPVFIDEFSPAGILVQTIALPTSANGANNILTLAGGTEVLGTVNLSVNGQYLTLGGISAPVGTANPSTGSTYTRVIGIIKYDGTVNTSTALTDFSHSGTPMSVVSTDGINLWACSNSFETNGSEGLHYTTIGSSTSIALVTTPESFNSLSIANGQLYAVRSGTPRIGTIGVGLSTSPGQTYSLVSGFPSGTGVTNFNQFVFADLNPNILGNDVLYAANRSTSATRGIEKYSFNGTSWVSNGVIPSSAGIAGAYSGLALTISGNAVTIFATRNGNNNATIGGGEIVTVTDVSGWNGTITGSPVTVLSSILSRYGSNNVAAYRGVALVPQAPPACPMPAIQISNILPSGATISWTSIPGVSTFQYALTNIRVPPISGTAISGNTFTATSLISNIKYYVHVRTNCGNFNYSAWVTDSFTTGCKAPAAPTIAITNIQKEGTADVNWINVAGAASYEYAVTSTSTPPMTGIVTSNTGFQASGLSSFTSYYAHVRSDCGSGGYSPWVSKAFNTGCLSPVVTLTPTGSGMTANWAKVNGALNYQYSLTNYLIPPPVGTITSDTIHQLNNLTSGAGYYFHVRSNCSSGGFSDWTSYEFHMPGMEAYPNPVKNTLTVRLTGIKNTGLLSIYDATGKCLQTTRMTGNTATVDMRVMSRGIYLVKYTDGQEKYSVKVMKQ